MQFDPPIVPLLRVAVPSAVRCFTVFLLLCFLIEGIHASEISTLPVDVIMVKSYVDSFLDPACVPVRISIDKLDFVPNRILAGLEGVFRNGGLVYPCRVL